MRKLAAVLLAFALMLMTMCITDSPLKAEDVFDYAVGNDGTTGVVTGYHGQSRDIVIPGQIGGHTITAVAAGAVDCFYAARLTIPDQVTSIATNAFINCGGLRELTMPASIKASIHPFGGMTRLMTLRLTAGEGTMPDFDYVSLVPWFDSQSSLLDVSLAEGIDAIGDHAFEGFSALQRVDMAVTINRIGVEAFSGCTALRTVTVPEGIISLAGSCFAGCTALKSVTLSNGLRQIGSDCFRGCTSLIDIAMPSSLESIGETAFSQVPLTATVLPQSVVNVGREAFDPGVKLWVYKGSGGADYAQDSGSRFEIINLMADRDSYEMDIGEVLDLAGSGLPTFITSDMNWSSRDPQVAAVDCNGRVTALAAGVTDITVTTATGSQSRRIKVFRFDGSDFQNTNLALYPGQTIALSPSSMFDVKDGRMAVYLYQSSDDTVASVDGRGTVQALTSGQAVITAASILGTTYHYQVTVKTPMGEIDPNDTTISMLTGETQQLECTTSPVDASDRRLLYESSNRRVVSISAAGLLRAVSTGTATVTIKAADGQGAQAKVTVAVNSARISVDTPVVPLPIGKYFHLRTVFKTTLPGVHVVYKTSDETIAAVDGQGVLHGLKAGRATISVASSDGLVADEVTVEVRDDAIAYGVDVSQWNGKLTVQRWTDMMKDGITFAFIRAGYNDSIDSRFEYAYQTAKKAGIQVGAYHFITALTVEEARQDAKYMLRWLKGKQFEYPIMLDVEEKDQRDLPVAQLNAMVDAYCSILADAGYCVTVYSYASMLNHINMRLRLKYDMYVAQWDSLSPDVFRYDYTIWQFTSHGRVNGSTGRFDMDISFFDYPSYMIKHHLNGY